MTKRSLAVLALVAGLLGLVAFAPSATAVRPPTVAEMGYPAHDDLQYVYPGGTTVICRGTMQNTAYGYLSRCAQRNPSNSTQWRWGWYSPVAGTFSATDVYNAQTANTPKSGPDGLCSLGGVSYYFYGSREQNTGFGAANKGYIFRVNSFLESRPVVYSPLNGTCSSDGSWGWAYDW